MHIAMNKQPCDFHEKRIFKFTFFLNTNNFLSVKRSCVFAPTTINTAFNYFSTVWCGKKSCWRWDMSVSIYNIAKLVTILLLSVYILQNCFQFATQCTLARYFWSHKNVPKYRQTNITAHKPVTVTLNLSVFCDRMIWFVVGSTKLSGCEYDIIACVELQS